MAETWVLDSGVRVLSKPIQEGQSIAIGLFARVGLAQEPTQFNGMAHFLEHMLFKGTSRRSAKKITETVDQIGAVINAQTSKEYTQFYMIVLPEHFELAVDILGDLFFHSKLSPVDTEKEKGVVLEEIYMVQDTPDDWVHDLYSACLWPDSILGRPILGDTQSVSRIDNQALLAFYEHYFNPENVFISLAGNLPSKQVIERTLKKHCSFKPSSQPSFQSYLEIATPKPSIHLLSKPIEQFHLCIGSGGISIQDPDRYQYTLFSMILGGSMSSRLFQEIRETRGWAYSIGSYLSCYQKAGSFCVYAGLNQKKLKPALRLICKALKKMADTPVSKRELSKVKQQLKGNMILSLESSSSWMQWQASSFMAHGRVLDVAEVIAKIDAVTLENIQDVALKMSRLDQLSLASIGPFSDKELMFNQRSVEDFID